MEVPRACAIYSTVKIGLRITSAFVFALILGQPSITYAVDPAPGAACAVNNARTFSGGVELGGIGHWLVCVAGTWQASYTSTAAGLMAVGTTGVESGVRMEVGGGLRLSPGASGAAGFLQLTELMSNGTNSVSLRAPDNIASNFSITLPNTSGSAGWSLVNVGNGTLGWTTGGAPSFPLLANPQGTVGAPAYSFSTTTNTGMYSTGVGTLAFSTAGANAVTITNLGRVGIGTTNPSERLSVHGGSIYVHHGPGEGLVLSSEGMSQSSNTEMAVMNESWNDLVFGTWGVERMRITHGSVGIGTASPTAKLQVQGDIKWAGAGSVGIYAPTAGNYTMRWPNHPGSLGQALITSGTGGILSWGTPVATPSFPLLANPQGTAGAPAYSFSTTTNTGMYSTGIGTLAFATAGTNAVTINNIGQVGVGTASPNTSLHINGNLRVAAGSSASPSIMFGTSTNTGFYGDGGDINVVTDGVNAASLNNTAWSIYRKIRSDNGDFSEPNFSFTQDSDTGMFSTGSNANVVGFSTAGTERMRIGPTGSVGIGTTAPTSRLEVQGDIKWAGAGSVGIYAPTAGNYSLRWPNHAGALGQALITSGTGGILSWGTPVATPSFPLLSTTFGSVGTPAYSFSGNSNTGMFLAGSGTLSFSTNGSENLRIHGDGNVTLGNFYDPNQKFRVGSNPYNVASGEYWSQYIYTFVNNNSNLSSQILSLEANTQVDINYNNGNSIGTRSKVSVGGGGATLNLGVGAQNEVNVGASSGMVTEAYATRSVVNNSNGAGIGTAAALWADVTRTSTGTIGTAYGLYVDALAGTNRWGIYQNGATDRNYFAGTVGIGTTNPLHALDVAPPGNAVGALGLRSTGGAGARIYFGTSGQYDGTGSNHAGVLTFSQQIAGGFEFRTNNGSGNPDNSAYTKLSITANGSVGIGTTAPTARLQVQNDIKWAGAGSVGIYAPTAGNYTLTWPAHAGAAGQALLTSGTGGILSWGAPVAATSFPLLANPQGTAGAPAYSFSNTTNTGMYSTGVGTLAFATSGAQRLTVTAAGSVGVGTATPSGVFSVGGPQTTNAYFFQDNADVGDGNDGQSVYISRRAAEGDNSMRFFIEHDQWANIRYDYNMILDASYLALNGFSGGTVVTGGNLELGLWGNNNPYLQVNGYLTEVSGLRYARFRVNDTTNNFELSRQDSNVGYFDINMPTIFTGGSVGIATTAPTARLQVQGDIKWAGAGSVGIYAPTAGNYTLRWPNHAGSAGQALLTSGTGGILSWGAPVAATSFPLLANPQGSAAAPAYSFSTTTNTGMYSTGVGTLAFATAGTNAITVNNLGNVGIGTATPNSKVSIAGIPAASTTSSLVTIGNPWTGAHSNGTYLGVNGDNSFTGSLLDLKQNDSSVFSVWANARARLGITAYGMIGGNFTWGVTGGSGHNFNGSYYGVTAAADYWNTVGVWQGYLDSTNLGVIGSYSGATASQLGFMTANGSGTQIERIRINSGGSIGIGTTAPSGVLSVGGAAETNAYLFYDNADVGDAIDGQSLYLYRRAAEGDNYIRTWIDQYRWANLATDAPNLFFRVQTDYGTANFVNNSPTAYNPTEASRYTPHSFPLVIENTAAVNGAAAGLTFGVNNVANSWPYQAAFIKAVSTTSGSSPNLVFGQRTGSNAYAERMRLNSGGSLGIGTTAPTARLHVQGNVQTTGGQVWSERQTSSAASPLTFNTDLGNSMVWTNANATLTVNVHNMKPGGSYLLVVAGAGTGSVTINCFSDAGSTALPSSFVPANGNRVNGTLNKTTYNLVSDGTNCLATWVTGF